MNNLEFANVRVTDEQIQALQDALRRDTYDELDFAPIVVTSEMLAKLRQPDTVRELAQVLREHWASAL